MSSVLQIIGAATLIAGVTLISIPAGIIMGGAVLILLGLALGK